ncbi:tyrosine-type recombinase/integrase [Streptomyces chartreusis]|uniref:tyrosine-type recombinase/integrase n=1 Tax=Streptomyces chartreusis TaxID=1969 RepID=UPI00341D93FD
MASVIKRCDCKVGAWSRCSHSWVVRFRDANGKQKEESFAHNKKKEANALAVKVENDKHLGVYVDRKNSKRTFEDCWNEWMNFGQREDSSIAQYKSIYKNHFADMFGSRRIGSITPSDLIDWESSQKERGYKPYGIEGRKTVLKSFLKYCYEAEIIAKYPGKTIKVNGRNESAYRPVEDHEIPTTAEVMAIYDAMRPAYKSSVWIQAGCGLRVGEALAFSRSHRTMREGWYFVQNQLTTFGSNEGQGRGVYVKNEPKWSRKGRWVPVPPSVADELEKHEAFWEPWGEEGWYYESETYQNRHPSRTTYTSRWDEAMRKAGLTDKGYTPKGLRHYFASMAIAAGVPLYEVARWMGHSSTKVTEQVYAHLVDGADERITGAFEASLADAFRSRLQVVSDDAA